MKNQELFDRLLVIREEIRQGYDKVNIVSDDWFSNEIVAYEIQVEEYSKIMATLGFLHDELFKQLID